MLVVRARMFRSALSSTFFYLSSDVYRVFISFRPSCLDTFDITARLFFCSKILLRYINCVDSKVTQILLKKNRRITKAVVSFVLDSNLLYLLRFYFLLLLRPIPLFPGSFSVKSRLVAYRKYSSPSPLLLPLPSTMFIEFPSLPLCSRALSFNMFRARMQGNLNIYSLS